MEREQLLQELLSRDGVMKELMQVNNSTIHEKESVILQLDDCKTSNAQLEERVECLLHGKSELENWLSLTKSRLAAQEEQAEEILTALQEKNADLLKTEEELSTAVSFIAEIEEELEETRTALKTNGEKLSKCTHELEDIRGVLSAKETEIIDLQKINAGLMSNLECPNESEAMGVKRLGNTSVEKQIMLKQKSMFENKIALFQTELSRLESSMSKELQLAALQLQDAENECAKLTAERDTLAKSLSLKDRRVWHNLTFLFNSGIDSLNWMWACRINLVMC